MVDTSTPLLQLVDQENGNNANTWGDIADANFLKLENAVSATTGIVSNSGTYTLTDTEARNMIHTITGTLSANQTVVMPTRSKIYLFNNSTSGNFFVTVKTAAGTGVFIPQGTAIFLFCDGTNIKSISQGPDQEIGTMKMNGVVNPPPGWLNCDGSPISRTTFAALFAKISTAFGVGDGSTTFNLPNFGARSPVGVGTQAGLSNVYSLGQKYGVEVVALSTANMPSHNHGISDPGHTHGYNDPGHVHSIPCGGGTSTAGAGFASTFTTQAGTITGGAAVGISIVTAATGISATTFSGSGVGFLVVDPKLAVYFIIRAF